MGKLDQHVISGGTMLTAAKKKVASATGRFIYRLCCHPAARFGIGPAWLFLVQYRLPIGLVRAG